MKEFSVFSASSVCSALNLSLGVLGGLAVFSCTRSCIAQIGAGDTHQVFGRRFVLGGDRLEIAEARFLVGADGDRIRLARPDDATDDILRREDDRAQKSP